MNSALEQLTEPRPLRLQRRWTRVRPTNWSVNSGRKTRGWWSCWNQGASLWNSFKLPVEQGVKTQTKVKRNCVTIVLTLVQKKKWVLRFSCNWISENSVNIQKLERTTMLYRKNKIDIVISFKMKYTLSRMHF